MKLYSNKEFIIDEFIDNIVPVLDKEFPKILKRIGFGGGLHQAVDIFWDDIELLSVRGDNDGFYVDATIDIGEVLPFDTQMQGGP